MSRDQILQRVRRATIELNQDAIADGDQSRANGDDAQGIQALANVFHKACAQNGTRVHTCAAFQDLPQTVANIIASNGPRINRVRVAGENRLTSLNWDSALKAETKVHFGAASAKDQIGISVAAWAIAETGTVVLASGPESPTTLAFLTETHIVAVERDNIIASLAGAMDKLQQLSAARDGRLPRAINLVSGASRTADIESKIVQGAHGPHQLHVVVIGGAGRTH